MNKFILKLNLATFMILLFLFVIHDKFSYRNTNNTFYEKFNISSIINKYIPISITIPKNEFYIIETEIIDYKGTISRGVVCTKENKDKIFIKFNISGSTEVVYPCKKNIIIRELKKNSDININLISNIDEKITHNKFISIKIENSSTRK